MVDEELAKWIASATKNGAPLALVVDDHGGTINGIGLANERASVYVPWGPHRPDYAALEEWLAGGSPKILHDAKRATKRLASIEMPLEGITFDTSLAAWLIRPGSKAESIAGQAYTHLGLTVPEPDP